MAKKTKELKKAKKVTDKKKAFGKPVDVTGVAGGACGCGGMSQDPVSLRQR